MHLEFHITEQDFVAFTQYHQWHAPNRKNYRLRTKLLVGFSFCCLPYLFFYLTYQYTTWPLFLNISIFSLVMFVAGYFWTPNYMRSYIRERSSKYFNHPANKHLADHTSVDFESDLIEYKTDVSEGTIKYEAIRRIAETKEYFYMYTSLEGAFIVPKSAFNSNQELVNFIDFITKKQDRIWKKTE